MTTGDPWADKFCCQVQAAFGPIDLTAVEGIAASWTAQCFGPEDRPVVRVALAVGPDFRVVDLVDATAEQLDPAGWSDEGFDESVMQYFHDRNFAHERGERLGFRSDEITLLIGASRIGLIYSHLFGDETVFFPKSRRLALAVCGLSTDTATPLTDVRPLTGSRIVGAAAQLGLRRPATFGSVARRVVKSRKVTPSPVGDEAMSVDPSAWWGQSMRIAPVSGPKIPSVLMYCLLLKELKLDSSATHHVVTDLRSYSAMLAGTDGNAISHVPFRADWNVDDPVDVARDISARIRSGEPLLRRAAAQLLSRRGRESAPMVTSVSALSTSMSYFRFPHGQAVADPSGVVQMGYGLQTLDVGALAINARDCDGTADLTFNHRGGVLSRSDVARAAHASARAVGCEVIFEAGYDHPASDHRLGSDLGNNKPRFLHLGP